MVVPQQSQKKKNKHHNCLCPLLSSYGHTKTCPANENRSARDAEMVHVSHTKRSKKKNKPLCRYFQQMKGSPNQKEETKYIGQGLEH